MTIKQLVKICHKVAIEKGFWDKCHYCQGKGKYKKIEYFYPLMTSSNFSLSPKYREKIVRCKNCEGRGNLINRNEGEMIALMHSELSEVLEELRKPTVNKNKVGEELGDCVIRIMDYCGAKDIDLEKYITNKIAKNKKRPYKHNKRF